MKSIHPTVPTLSVLKRLAGRIVRLSAIERTLVRLLSWIMDRHWFINEQYLLQAFVAFSSRVEVMWVGSYMHLTDPDLLEEANRANRWDREWPGSFWMRMK